MDTRRAFLATVLLTAGLSAAPAVPAALRAGRSGLPTQLSDQQFWRIIDTFSEPGGTFHSDNFVSNEGRFQAVIPDLIRRATPGRLYIGVGPEQNFSYITAVRPQMAFIIDIRRGNLHEHLLYKALMEMSPTRADFLGRLFSRARPAGLTTASRPEALFAAFDAVPASDVLYRENFAAVIAWLTRKHAFPLSAEDVAGIGYVFRTAFFADGPELGYQLTGQGRASRHPTYAYLMSIKTSTGEQHSYLATEERFQFLKTLQSRNLVVPVVGDFGGARALPAIAKYARDNGSVVSAFYLSNVEQYLNQDGKWGAFCATVATMPLDATSTFIRSRVNGRGLTRPRETDGAGMFWSDLGPMQSETKTCTAAAVGRR